MKLYIVLIDARAGWDLLDKVFTDKSEAQAVASKFNALESSSYDEDVYYEGSTALVKTVEI